MLEPKKKGRPSSRPTIKDFSRNWDKMSRQELASYYKVSIATITRWASEFRKELGQSTNRG